MNKKQMIIAAGVLIGLWILLRKPEDANATEVDIEPEDKADKPSSSTQTGPILPIPKKLETQSSDNSENYDVNKAGYVSGVVKSLMMPTVKVTLEQGDSPADPLTDEPRQGKWYRVKKGDVMVKIMRRAGLQDKDWRAMRDHINNDWLPKTYPDGSYFQYTPGEKSLPMFAWFDSPGYQTTCRWQSGGVYPVIYIPTEDEVR